MASFALSLILSQGLKAQVSFLGILLPPPPAHWSNRCCLLAQLPGVSLFESLLAEECIIWFQPVVRFPHRKLLFSLSKVPLHLPVLLLSPALSLYMLLFGTELGKASLMAALIFVVGSETIIPCCQPHGSLVILGLGLCTWKAGWSGCDDG